MKTDPERLHKVLAAGGFGSRRECERLIQLGEVEVDGKIVTELGCKVDPFRQRIRCGGRLLRPPRLRTFAMNKPRGVLCTAADERGRRTVFDLLPGVRERLFSVGRLDAESQGLLLLTNDGALCETLTHPRYQIPRVYHVRGVGSLTGRALDHLKRGVWLAEGKTGPVRARIKHRERNPGGGERIVLEITVREGMNREVRRVLARYGFRVKRLKRVQFGPIHLGALREGQFRELAPAEVARLKSVARERSHVPGK